MELCPDESDEDGTVRDIDERGGPKLPVKRGAMGLDDSPTFRKGARAERDERSGGRPADDGISSSSVAKGSLSPLFHCMVGWLVPATES